MMNSSVRIALAVGVLGTALSAGAQGVPGEDPVQLTGPVRYLNLPGPPTPKSGQIDGNSEMPAWMKARVARYEAKSFSATANDGTISTSNDVVNTATAQGLGKTCVQEVGSVTSAANSIGSKTLGGQQQIVVLRGDLVNICR
jgi:hypothetical protein